MMRVVYFFLVVVMMGCNKNEAPTGVSRTDVEGVWAASLGTVNLMGRTLVGESDWQFNRSTFEIAFLDPPVGHAERISGDWKFKDGKMVMTLRSSFPIVGDVGASDTMFVSILNNQMSLQTLSGSNILLVKLRSFAQAVLPEPIWVFLPAFLPSFFGA
ncbi:MAG: hypothetical protein ACO36I_20130 [Candidatus Latescibacterota bacterium]|jgi:hypothetical protein